MKRIRRKVERVRRDNSRVRRAREYRVGDIVRVDYLGVKGTITLVGRDMVELKMHKDRYGKNRVMEKKLITLVENKHA